MTTFAHLHCHTNYSFQDGLIHHDALCKKAVSLGMKSVAMTDHGNLHGVMSFYKTAQGFDLKPIIGCEVYICPDHELKTPKSLKHTFHLVLLARNNIGYANLVKLVSIGALKGFYHYPRIDKSLLRKYSEGLVCLSACISGEIPQAIIAGDMDGARDVALEYRNIFKNDFFFEVQKNGLDVQDEVNNGLAELAKDMDIRLVATSDCHYLEQKDARDHNILKSIPTKKILSEINSFHFGSDEFYFKSPHEMERDFSSYPEAIEVACEIAKDCNVEFPIKQSSFPVSGANDPDYELGEIIKSGLDKRGKFDDSEYRDRIDKEYNIICEFGFSEYFLFFHEVISWAKNHKILVGPGRGSGPGSLVAWAIGITDIDPIAHGLHFERFFNPLRGHLPDIEIDLCKKRREEVMGHIIKKYGKDYVANAPMLSEYNVKEAIKKTGTALGISSEIIANILNNVSYEGSLSRMKVDELDKIAGMYKTNNDIVQLIDAAKTISKCIKEVDSHHASIVIDANPLVDSIPLCLDKGGKITSQVEWMYLKNVGLGIYKFLGFSTLSFIGEVLSNIAKNGKEVPDLNAIPLDDADVYSLYGSGNTLGIFYADSPGLTQFFIDFGATCFEDMIAILSLYRPGPLGCGMVDDIIKRKQGLADIVYPHESLRGCLCSTYGIPVYQEQIMTIANLIAGYTLEEADILRRTMRMRKNIPSERIRFANSANKNGISEEIANETFDMMVEYSEYSFNKSHAVGYAMVSYQTAWLKIHYPQEFMDAYIKDEDFSDM